MNDTSSKETKVVFRSAMGGYNKKDVNEYIQNENRRFASIEQSYNSTIDQLRRELNGAADEVRRLNERTEAYETIVAKLAEAEAANAALKEKLQGCENKNTSLKSELDTVKAEADASASQVGIALTELENAKTELASAKADAESAKAALAKMIEEAANRPAESAQNRSAEETEESQSAAKELLSRARSASEEMLKRAEEGAGVILDRARKEALDYSGEIFAAAKEIFTAATEELRRSIGICMSDFVSGIRTAKGNSDRVADDAIRCDDDLSRRIERMQNDLDRAIAEKLAEFDRKSGNGK